MKKFFPFILVFIILIPVFICVGCSNDKKISDYSIILTYDDVNNTAEANTIVNYINNSENALSFIKFHLYPNAFSEEADGSVCTTVNEVKTYPNGKSWGGIDISKVSVNGALTDFEFEECANTILTVPLGFELFPDETVKIQIEYKLTLPNANHRFGYGENTVNFGNFYPIVCVYEEKKGFITDPYVSNGDPFYSEIANYSLSISYPCDYTIACSGDNIKTSENGDFITTTFISNKVRDVSFILSDKFSSLKGKSNDTDIYYFYYSDQDPQGSLDTAIKALNFYSDSFGDYPYSSLCVVETNFVHGGMEYPRLVMISDALVEEDYDYVISHEIAHQWWYGVVGNDEFNEAWIDESLTEFSTALFFGAHKEYGLNYNQIIDGANSNYKFFLKIYKKINSEVDTSMLRSLIDFKTEPEYVNNIYTRGIIMFDTLKQQLGDKKILSILKSYFKNFSYQNVSTEQFVAFFSKKSGTDLEKFFDSWLNGKVVFIVE